MNMRRDHKWIATTRAADGRVQNKTSYIAVAPRMASHDGVVILLVLVVVLLLFLVVVVAVVEVAVVVVRSGAVDGGCACG